MRPPMRQKVTAFIPHIVEGKPVTDKYGKPVTIDVHSKARVRFKSSVIRSATGQERRVALEIDLPPSLDVAEGQGIEYESISGRQDKGIIAAVEEATNLSGSKVYFRTVFVDG